jgi:hypothetical protein
VATGVFDFDHCCQVQVPTPLVLDLNHTAVEQALAPEVFNPGCRDFAPMLFHT